MCRSSIVIVARTKKKKFRAQPITNAAGRLKFGEFLTLEQGVSYERKVRMVLPGKKNQVGSINIRIRVVGLSNLHQMSHCTYSGPDGIF